MISVIGWLGGILLALCGLPLAWSAYKTGKDNTNRTFLHWWLTGEVMLLTYVFWEHGFDWPLLFNYTSNIFLILFVLRYNYYPRR